MSALAYRTNLRNVDDEEAVRAPLSFPTLRPSPIIKSPEREIGYLLALQLGHERKRLARPLKVEISSGEDVAFMVFASATETWGTGDSLEAALTDLSDTTWALWDELRQSPSLDAHARELLSRLDLFLR